MRKKNGESRLYVDFRELNKVTMKDNFSTPLINDRVDRLKEKKYFSSFDLKNRFYHVKMSKFDKIYVICNAYRTVLVSPDAIWVY